MIRNSSLIINLGVSFLGLVIVILLVLFSSASNTILWQKQIISLIFGSLCFFGAIAVLIPNQCSRIAFGGKKNIDDNFNLSSDRFSSFFGIKLIHGHHPKQKSFAKHEFQIRNKSICSGCFGLFIGAIVSIGGIIIYNFVSINFSSLSHSFVGLGVLAVALSVFSPLFFNASSVFRILINAFFVIGMLFILVGIDSLSISFGINLFLIGIFVFWMMTRIFVSKYNHDKIFNLK